MIAVALALSVSLAWGFVDYAAARASRRVAVIALTAGVQAVGVLAGVALVLITGDARPTSATLAAALGAGLVSAASLTIFYKALSVGRASLVAPVSATGVALPVIVGLARGERPSALALAGIVAAAVGVVVVLATAHHGEPPQEPGGARRSQRLPVALALLASTGLGSFLVLADRASEESVAWFVLVARLAASLPLVAAALVLRSRLPPLRSRLTLAIVAMGLIDGLAWAASGAAFARGDLATVSVLVSLYPVITVLLATWLAHERMRPVEIAGVVAALVGVVLIAGG